MSTEDSAKTPVHRSVLLEEVLTGLHLGPGQIIVDGTVGAGGHAAEIARRVEPGGRVIGMDRDDRMIELAAESTRGLPVKLIQRPYSDLHRVLDDEDLEGVDGILLDLGLSSDQLAWEDRGFSFGTDGPLDMRYDSSSGDDTASDLVNNLSETELADIFFQFGEERHSRRVARRIVEARRVEPILTTGRLADLVRKSIPGKWGPIDPATRVFQALRIATNRELEHLETILANLSILLNLGGRVAIISFHSLEDRQVKHAFRDDPELEVITRKPVMASEDEIRTNPRARSAKLRVAQRCTRQASMEASKPSR